MLNPVKIIDSISDGIDKNMESEQERQATLTERLTIDTTSPFKLPHLIRPITLIWAIVNETILTWATIILAFYSGEVDPNASMTLMAALAANSTILGTIIGFYFQSRKNEKMLAKKMAATIKIEEMKHKSEIKIEEIKYKDDRKDEELKQKEDAKDKRKRLQEERKKERKKERLERKDAKK